MKCRSAQVVTALILGSAVLFSAMTASASKQAVVKLKYIITSTSGLTSPPFATRNKAAGTYGSLSATVSTTNAPTPTIGFPASILAGNVTATYSGPFVPYLYSQYSFMNMKATLSKSHVGAAPTAGSNVPIPTNTTLCFAGTTGSAPLPNSCFPRIGVMGRTAGSKKFGGTARFLANRVSVGTSLGYTGLSLFDLTLMNPTGPDTQPGQYAIYANGVFSNTVLGNAFQTQNHRTSAPPTTGVIQASGGNYNTMITLTGSHNFNTTNLTGMISVVKPYLLHQFARNPGGAFTGVLSDFSLAESLEITFAGEVPEPAAVAMFGIGILGLAGLAARRRR